MAFATIFKIPLLLLNAYCVHVAFTPPNPPPKKQEKVKYDANRAGDTIPMVELKGPEIQKVQRDGRFTENITE